MAFSTNALIETIFAGFTVDEAEIPVSFLRYDGNADTYVTYQMTDADNSLSGDDHILAFVGYYDFDVYSKSNYFPILSAIIDKLEQNGFVWQPSRSSPDMFEDDTGLFHKTLCFAIPEI